jgi:hypothetical protein
LWNVTRSTRPESCSSEGSEGAAVMAGWSLCRAGSRAGPGGWRRASVGWRKAVEGLYDSSAP